MIGEVPASDPVRTVRLSLVEGHPDRRELRVRTRCGRDERDEQDRESEVDAVEHGEIVTTMTCGLTTVFVTRDEAVMGRLTAEHFVGRLKEKRDAGVPVALWLMAAPSAFAFYRELIGMAEADASLRGILRETEYFQFDDYPIGRDSPQFPTTFRHLLEAYLYRPLAAVCGSLPGVHALELTGADSDGDVQAAYRDAILRRKERGVYFLQLKGIGMDGHWGFHGAETPLDMEPGMINVTMNTQNIRQQMLDWPAFFPTPADVPRTACTFNVPMFLLADEIVDNVPQASKVFSVLATYGTEEILGDVPSSALKGHPCARAYVTAAAAEVLLAYRGGAKLTTLDVAARERLRSIWRDPDHPESESRNIAWMESVLCKLGMVSV